jgi:hypothetical protein
MTRNLAAIEQHIVAKQVAMNRATRHFHPRERRLKLDFGRASSAFCSVERNERTAR